jgi:hypothetical protein
MTRDGVNAELVRQREAELRRAAARHSARADDVPVREAAAGARPQDAVTIRLAAADDGRELDLLARVHGAGVLRSPSLIAELGGRPVAAMSLRDRSVIADPGERTADVVELLRLRASQLLGSSRRSWAPLRVATRLSRGLLPR